MFFRLLFESILRQRRRKMLAGIAILLGTTAVTAMLALATTIGDRIHQELAVYGANIVVFPKADSLDVKVGGVDVKPATGGAHLKESDLERLHGIFWANNITGVSPELSLKVVGEAKGRGIDLPAVGYSFIPNAYQMSSNGQIGALLLHPWWKISGKWPQIDDQQSAEIAIGNNFLHKTDLRIGDVISVPTETRGRWWGVPDPELQAADCRCSQCW